MTPREHAAAICAETERDARLALLNRVPTEYRELVKTHVRNALALRKLRGEG